MPEQHSCPWLEKAIAWRHWHFQYTYRTNFKKERESDPDLGVLERSEYEGVMLRVSHFFPVHASWCPHPPSHMKTWRREGRSSKWSFAPVLRSSVEKESRKKKKKGPLPWSCLSFAFCFPSSTHIHRINILPLCCECVSMCVCVCVCASFVVDKVLVRNALFVCLFIYLVLLFVCFVCLPVCLFCLFCLFVCIWVVSGRGGISFVRVCWKGCKSLDKE